MAGIPVGALVRDRELPELGPGRIIAELDGGASRIAFEHSDEVRDVHVDRVEISRLPLIPGTQVQVRSGGFGNESTDPGEVIEAELPDAPTELCDYRVRVDGESRTVSEAELFPRHIESTDPVDQFDALYWRGPFRFFARWGMHRMRSRLYGDAEGLPALIGARVNPKPGPIHAARRVLWDRVPRYVLADELWQDRMTAAGLVTQCLASRQPDQRVLIIAPGATVDEWADQMEMRFGGRSFVTITEQRLAGMEFHETAGLMSESRVVVSTSALRRSEDAQTMLVGQEWDVVIMDDAHRLPVGGAGYRAASDASRMADTALVLAPTPVTEDAESIASLLRLARPDVWREDAVERVDERFEERRDVWHAMKQTDEAIQNESFRDEAEDIAKLWRESAADDEAATELLSKLEQGDPEAARDLLDHARSWYGVSRRLVRSPRDIQRRAGVDWADRSHEVLEYDPDEAEEELADHLGKLAFASDDESAKQVVRSLYLRRSAASPTVARNLFQDRMQAVDGDIRDGESTLDVLGRLESDPGPRQESALFEHVLDKAPVLENERDWLGRALGIVKDWDRETGHGCARFLAALNWIEQHLESNGQDLDGSDEADEGVDSDEPPPKVVVATAATEMAEAFATVARSRFGQDIVELLHAGTTESGVDEAADRFRDPATDCRLIICDETVGRGRSLRGATAMVHLELPWSPDRLDRRIGRIDQPGKPPAHSVVLVGPTDHERALLRFHRDALDLLDGGSSPYASRFPQLERDWFDVCTLGEQSPDEWVEETADKLESADQASSLQAGLNTPVSLLSETLDFADLLDFIDGLDNPLPVRHWARMIGIDDHRSRPGVYDFKWHWSSVRRDLPGFEMPEGDDPAEWSDEETVQFLSGTFSRKKALKEEPLDFFGPGHRLVDALMHDALGPTDGRATIFSRHVDPEYQGRVFAILVCRCDLNEALLDEHDVSAGLKHRVYRRFWPETTSAVVEFELGETTVPKVVDDPDLIHRLEESYEGPDADQKIEYEQFIRAIEDATRFRESLREAIDTGLDSLRDEREPLVDDAVERLEREFGRDIDFFESADSGDVPEDVEGAIEVRRALIDAVREYDMDVDAIALVVGGTPQDLLRG